MKLAVGSFSRSIFMHSGTARWITILTISAFVDLLGSGLVWANTISGTTRKNDGTIVGGVSVAAYQVKADGSLTFLKSVASNPLGGDKPGQYTIDGIDPDIMVVLVCTADGLKSVSVPTPQTPTPIPGGALSAKSNITGLDVVLYPPP
jgi:hypothetical protein